jgi:hypothetical protein
VKRDVRRALRLLVVATFALVVIAAFVPGRLGFGARIYALVLCVTALVLALMALRQAFPAERPLHEGGRAPARHPPPASLTRIEHEAALAVASAFELHYRFVPRLRSIAAGLLASRRRISLSAQPAAARDALDASTWELVRPDRPAPEDRLARGFTAHELEGAVDSLEAV